MQINYNSQRAATLTEYAIILAILMAVFIGFGKALEMSAGKRARESVRAVESDVPCAKRDSDGNLVDVSPDVTLGENPDECL